LPAETPTQDERLEVLGSALMFQRWSFAKVALVSVGWIGAWLLVAVAWLLMPVWRV
jgi:hypothetical protein